MNAIHRIIEQHLFRAYERRELFPRHIRPGGVPDDEPILHIFTEVFSVIIILLVYVRIDFHHITIQKITRRSKYFYIIKVREINGLHNLSGARETITTGIHKIEIPISRGQ